MVTGAVLDHAVGRPAGAQRGEIDEQLERRSGLPPRLGGAVERAVLVALAADHRDDAAVRAHRDQRRLRIACGRARDGANGQPLKVGVERRPDLHLAEVGLERVARLGRDPVGEIGAGRNLR